MSEGLGQLYLSILKGSGVEPPDASMVIPVCLHVMSCFEGTFFWAGSSGKPGGVPNQLHVSPVKLPTATIWISDAEFEGIFNEFPQ